MTARFQAELATRGRDWSDNKLSDKATAFMYEQITPDETVVASGIVSISQRANVAREFLAKDNQNVIVFYPLFAGDLPESEFGGFND